MRVVRSLLFITITSKNFKKQCLKIVVLTSKRYPRITTSLIGQLTILVYVLGMKGVNNRLVLIYLNVPSHFNMIVTDFLVKH